MIVNVETFNVLLLFQELESTQLLFISHTDITAYMDYRLYIDEK